MMRPINLRTIPHLRLRTEFSSIIIRARATLLAALPSFFASSIRHHQCIQVQPPIITSSDCEGVGEVFTVIPRSSTAAQTEVEAVAPALVEHYFKEPKYLTVSSQLHLEAFSAELGDVWALSPTFRAEHSDTPRHLSEFHMFEAELRGVETLESIMTEVEKGIISLVLALRDGPAGKELIQYYTTRGGDKVDLEDRWSRVLAESWKAVTYTSAMEELTRACALDPMLFEHAPDWHSGLQLEHERWIVANIGLDRPVFVTHYPASIKPFYMLLSSDEQDLGDKSTVACFDLLFPDGYCEIVGGSLREHRLENLIQNMRKAGLLEKKPLRFDIADDKLTRDYPFLRFEEDLGALKWYADLRRFGSSPHGGFGMGFDRLLAYLTGVANLRDVVSFPRTWGRADC
jgi:asparaginyl-tRNA synthetase